MAPGLNVPLTSHPQDGLGAIIGLRSNFTSLSNIAYYLWIQLIPRAELFAPYMRYCYHTMDLCKPIQDRELRRLEPSDLFESGKVRLDGFSEFSEGRKVPFVLDCHVELCDLLKDCLFEVVKDLLTCKGHFLFC